MSGLLRCARGARLPVATNGAPSGPTPSATKGSLHPGRPPRRLAELHDPPGPTRFSAKRTYRTLHDPLPILLDCFERHGPVFTHPPLRRQKTRCGITRPEANNFVLVAHPENFVWRDGCFGDLIPLLGDGLLTDRRRLPRPRPPNDDARVPLGADPGLPKRWRRKRPRRWRAWHDGEARWASTSGCGTSRCESPCGRCSDSTPIRAGMAPVPLIIRGRAWLLRGPTPPCGSRRGAGSAWRRMTRVAARRPRRDRLRRDRPGAARTPTTSGWTSSACDLRTRTRTDRASAIPRSATR